MLNSMTYIFGHGKKFGIDNRYATKYRERNRLLDERKHHYIL